MIKLFQTELSGNCHKVRLMLALLQVQHELVPVDMRQGEHQSAEFLQLNPLGQIPVLVDDDVIVRDSQAILIYLARRYGDESWLPLDAVGMSKVMQWLSFAANEIQHSLFIARLHFRFGMALDWESAQQRGQKFCK